MGKFKDLTGLRIGRWEVLKRVPPPSGSRKTFWLCRCQCARRTLRKVDGGNLGLAMRGTGGSTSCGCQRKESLSRLNTRHGDSVAPKTSRRWKTFKSWQDMKSRCDNPNTVSLPVAPRNVKYPHKGQMLTRRQIAELEGVPVEAFSQRMHKFNGDVQKSLEKPFKPGAK